VPFSACAHPNNEHALDTHHSSELSLAPPTNLRCLLPLRRQALAVSAPWGVELDHHEPVLRAAPTSARNVTYIGHVATGCAAANAGARTPSRTISLKLFSSSCTTSSFLEYMPSAGAQRATSSAKESLRDAMTAQARDVRA
jgi:hypothetical protein